MKDLMNEKLKIVASLLDEIQTISGVVNKEGSNLYDRICKLRCDLEDIKEDNECSENMVYWI